MEFSVHVAISAIVSVGVTGQGVSLGVGLGVCLVAPDRFDRIRSNVSGAIKEHKHSLSD